jgi:hypothetical protein
VQYAYSQASGGNHSRLTRKGKGQA